MMVAKLKEPMQVIGHDDPGDRKQGFIVMQLLHVFDNTAGEREFGKPGIASMGYGSHKIVM